MTDEGAIVARVRGIMQALPPGTSVIAAAKGRRPEEAMAALCAGVHGIGHNYVQEAERMIPLIAQPAEWHMIGHLQRSKVKSAVRLFDMIQTVDSHELATEIEKRCAAIGKIMPVLIEVNSGRELSKTGIMPEQTEELARQISLMSHLRLQGLMTMGPRFGDPENARPFFRLVQELFDHLGKAHLPDIEMRFLSMGMSNSYRIALEEGANMVRLGTVLFAN